MILVTNSHHRKCFAIPLPMILKENSLSLTSTGAVPAQAQDAALGMQAWEVAEIHLENKMF